MLELMALGFAGLSVLIALPRPARQRPRLGRLVICYGATTLIAGRV